MFFCTSLNPKRYNIPSNPTVEIDCLALAFTFGFAWNAIPNPAKFSMGKSFAPSPTATVCCSSIFSTWAISLKSSAFRLPSTTSPANLPVSLPSSISNSLAYT